MVGSKIFKQGGEIRSHFWLLYCFVLLGTAMMWCYYVEEPWVGWLKGRLESWRRVRSRCSEHGQPAARGGVAAVAFWPHSSDTVVVPRAVSKQAIVASAR